MNRYRVEARQTLSTSYLVEANSEQEAKELAWMASDEGIEPTTSYCETGDFHVINVQSVGAEYFNRQVSFIKEV